MVQYSRKQFMLPLLLLIIVATAAATPPGIAKNPSHATCKIKKYKHCYNLVHVCPKFCPDECTVECASCKPICGPGSPYPDQSPPPSEVPAPTPPSEVPTPPPPSEVPAPTPPSEVPAPNPPSEVPAPPPPSEVPAPPPPSEVPAPPPPSEVPAPTPPSEVPAPPPPSEVPAPPPPSEVPAPPPPSEVPAPTPPSEVPVPPPPSEVPAPTPPSEVPAPPPPSEVPAPTPPSEVPAPPPSSEVPAPPPPSEVPAPPPPSEVPAPPPPSELPAPTPPSEVPAPPPPSELPAPPPPSELPAPTPPSEVPAPPPPSELPAPPPPSELPAPPPSNSSSGAGQRRSRCKNRNYPHCYNTEHVCPSSCPGDCEVDCVTCKPVCKCDRPGAVCQDPRFIGGDGITFYFHGKKDHDFCLVSDSKIHINGHFIGRRNQNMKRDFTWVQSIGILFDKHQLYIGALKTATWEDAVDRLAVTFDSKPVTLPEFEGTRWQSISVPRVSVTRAADMNSVIIDVEGMVKITAKVVPITEEDSRIHNYGVTDDDCLAHLDLGFKFFSLSNEVSGVLGQTYRGEYVSRVKIGAAMPVMGGDKEFRSSSLLATDCEVSKFVGNSDSTMETTETALESLEMMPTLNCASGIDGKGVVCKR